VATKTLVIDGSNLERFFLAVQAGTLRIGDSPAHPEGTLEGLQIVRIRCEVDVEDGRDSFPIDQAGVIAPQVLRAGAEVRLTHARLSLRAGEAGNGSGTTPAPVAPAASPTPNAPHVGPKRLKVTDGGDQGRSFPLPEVGTVSVGKAGAQAEIGLHDFYVAKVHCTLTVENGTVRVTHVEGPHGTLIDNQKITQPQVLKPGSVLRVGNSHLRLEVGPFADEPTAQPVESEKKDGSGVLRAIPKDGSGVLRASGSGSKPALPKGEDALTELVDQTIGHYHVERLLGRGFSGAVFRATNTKTSQPAALKVLAPEFPAAPAELDQFAQELKVAQPIRHPNLVALFGAGKTATHCWIAREFVEGESAAAVIARIAEGEKPSWTRAARVVVHLARALDHLHQHRLIHGNITPRNVLFQTSDNATKLTDLRLLQILAKSQLQQKVAEKKLLAELPYQAPEQVTDGVFVDHLADLYAVGALAHALCTGQRPVSGKTAAEIREQIRNGRVSKPSLIYKKVPPAFDAIVLKLMARNQEDRYQTALAVLADLAPLAQSHDLKL
jgi:pSer/pThr/pTyr-binding forkhead associated (FHA) protein